MDVAHGLRKSAEFLRNVFARETLGTAPEDPTRSHGARALARALLEIEELPFDPEPPARARTRGETARASLPPEPPPEPSAARGRGVLAALFAPEPLPEDPPEPPRPRHPWLAWLFRPESLDPPWR